MDTTRSLLLGALCFLACAAHASEHDPSYEDHFDSNATLGRWVQHSGSWSISGGAFLDSVAGPADIVTVEHYEPDTIQWPTMHEDYGIDVYARFRDAGDATVGVVFDFTDPANHHEVTFSSAGIAFARTIIGGVETRRELGRFPEPGVDKWFHISVLRVDQKTTVKVNGVNVLTKLQDGLPAGDAGLISHNTRGQFDDFHVRDFSQVDPYTEDFDDGAANRWSPLAGTWAPSNFGYASTAVNATSVALSPVTEIWDYGVSPNPVPFTFKTRMKNGYGGSGNLVGILWLDGVSDLSRYTEVVFSPLGQARINSVVNGVRTVLAQAPYEGGGHGKWFEVEVAGNGDFSGTGGYVKVNGVTVFDPLPNSDVRGPIGLITHWAPALFDDVRAAPAFFRPLSASMDDGHFPERFFSPLSSWRVQNGTLNSFGVGPNDTAGLDVFHDIQDIEYRARIVNHFAAAGNLVGLTYAYRGPEDYFEVVFSPTGVAKLNRRLKGQTTTVATAPYQGGGPRQWFDVRLMQRDLFTTVLVNGAPVFTNVWQPDAGGARVGFVTHWANANFDDISVTEIPPAP